MVRFGFLGAGWVARRAMAPAVQAAEGAVLQAVAARDPERAAALEPRGQVHDSYRALLADPEVDVVYLNLSNEAHAPWTIAALAAGKHVLCEKPLALSVSEVSAMREAADAAGRLLVEALWFRWHPRLRRVAALVADGALGAVRAVETEFSFLGDFGGSAATNYRLEVDRGGGALYDTGCYCLSATHLALGDGPATVVRAHSMIGESGVDLTTTAALSVGRGSAAVRCSMASPDRQRLRIVGDEACVELTVGEAFANWNAPSALRITTPGGVTRDENFAPVDPYRSMVEQVCAAVRGDPGWVVGLDHSLAVARTTQAIRDMARAPQD